jgi:hypothetical protein
MTASIRLCQVTEGEDFSVLVVTDPKRATLDAEFVACGEESDARVKVVTDERLAVEFVLV